MSDSPPEKSSTSRASEPVPKLRFVTARPDTKEARREARAAIRAHASQASWAKIKSRGKQKRQEVFPIGTSPLLPPSDRDRNSSAADETASTELVSSSNDRLWVDVTSEGQTHARPRQAVLSRAVRHSVLESLRLPNPLRTVGLRDVDPFTNYPSRLPKEIVIPIMGKGEPTLQHASHSRHTCWCGH